MKPIDKMLLQMVTLQKLLPKDEKCIESYFTEGKLFSIRKVRRMMQLIEPQYSMEVDNIIKRFKKYGLYFKKKNDYLLLQHVALIKPVDFICT